MSVDLVDCRSRRPALDRRAIDAVRRQTITWLVFVSLVASTSVLLTCSACLLDDALLLVIVVAATAAALLARAGTRLMAASRRMG